MTIAISVDDIPYTNFTNSNVKIDLDAVSGSFSFTAVTDQAQPVPFQIGDECVILVNDQAVVTGFIEILNISYNSNEHKIVVEGRDKTADLIDSTIEGIKLSPPISLKQAIQKALDQIGENDIEIIENTPTGDFKKAEEKINGSIGQNAFEFCENLARKRQVLLTRDGLGNIVITQGSGIDSKSTVQNIVDAKDNNIKSGSIGFDLTQRYFHYIVKSQLNPVALNFAGDTSSKEITNQIGNSFDEIRQSRHLVIKAENSSSSEQCIKRAIWENNIRKARGRIYSCTVQGFNNSAGNLYQPNQLIQVVDQFCEINAKMLLNSVEFSFDVNDGSISTLSFVDSNAYTLDLTEPKTEKIGASAVIPKFLESRLK